MKKAKRTKWGNAKSWTVVLGLVAAAGPAHAEPRVELETFLGGQPALMGLGMAVASLGGGTRIGLPLGERLVAMVGFEARGGGSDQEWSYMVTVPVELKVYLTRPVARGLVPQLRLGGGYTRGGWTYDGNSSTADRVHGYGGLGVQYFFTEAFAAGLDVGLTYGRSSVDSDEPLVSPDSQGRWDLALDWRLGLLIRI